MLGKVESRAVWGISTYRVDVEVDITGGIPSFCIVGLPDAACRESAKRVLAALKNSGYQLPSRHVTVNLAPAYVRKEGPVYDLAIALAILAALGEMDKDTLLEKVVCGELSLDGCLRPVKGALAIADGLRNGEKVLILPHKNISEISAVTGLNYVTAQTLNEVITYVAKGIMPELSGRHLMLKKNQSFVDLDYADIKGNNSAKRALEVAAAGGHNILLIGPPGVGKTMMAKRLPTILDDLSELDALETSKIFSVAGLLDTDGALISRPPFRMLHHSVSNAGMIGGGSYIRPGEISLAHNGVLFLDELTEFRRDVLEALRQPLEEGVIRISRAHMSVTYPARFMLVAAMNPCPCGFLTHPDKACMCTPPQVQRYLSKVSGPLLDRIDLHIELQPIHYDQMRQRHRGETSAAICQRVKKARIIQEQRYATHNFKLNAQLPHTLSNEVCQVSEEAQSLLGKAMAELFFSARAYDRILKVAQTIADLDGRPIIGAEEISEAIGYRALDNKIWLQS